MKRKDLQPTMDNIKQTFINDTIGRNKDLLNFIQILCSINDNYSIALDSSWGSGKTFFVKQVKMIFDSSNEFGYNSVERKDEIMQVWNKLSENVDISANSNVTIYYDAWENDCDEDPIYSLIYQIVLDTNNNEGLKRKISFDDVLIAAGRFTEAISGINPNEIVESLKSKSILEELIEKKSIDDIIKKFIDSILPEHGDRLIIIIDELDRCNPKFAVKLLERIKHYFYNNKVTFVFSVNLSELQHTIKHYYGDNFNAGKYLDRFFDLRISLPPANLNKYYKSIGFYNSSDVIDETISLVIRKYNLQLREIAKFITIVKAATFEYERTGNSHLQKTKQFLLQVVVPMAIGLELTDPYKYSDFVSGNNSSPLKEFYGNYEIISNVSYFLSILYNSDLNLESTDNNGIHGNFIERRSPYLLTLHNNLDIFYNIFFNGRNEQKIGRCLIRDTDREFFFNVMSLLSPKSTNILTNTEEP